MNIFYLDTDPQLAAQYHADKHVVKMILESAQLLCTAVNELSGRQLAPYKTTHKNHPSAIWVRESIFNFCWLEQLMFHLNEEYKYRYNKKNDHLSYLKLQAADIVDMAMHHYPNDSPATPIKLAVAADCRLRDPVSSYREYYRKYKSHLFHWTKRGVPEWINH